MPPLRGREVDGALLPDEAMDRSPGAPGRGIIKPSALFLRGEELSLFERVVLTRDGVADDKDLARAGSLETRSLVNLRGLGAERSAKRMTGIDESASRGVTPMIFDLMGSTEAGEECTCDVSPSTQ